MLIISQVQSWREKKIKLLLKHPLKMHALELFSRFYDIPFSTKHMADWAIEFIFNSIKRLILKHFRSCCYCRGTPGPGRCTHPFFHFSNMEFYLLLFLFPRDTKFYYFNTWTTWSFHTTKMIIVKKYKLYLENNKLTFQCIVCVVA